MHTIKTFINLFAVGVIAALTSSPLSAIDKVAAANQYSVHINSELKPAVVDLACNNKNAPLSCQLRIYQIMVGAFVDADKSANYQTGYGPSHHNGDLQGIINSLDYIRSIGVNAIWLTPIFHTVAHPVQDALQSKLDATGYNTSNYFAVDPKFGTEAQLKELVEKAHAKGLYVLLDGVFGHFKENAHQYPSPKGLHVSKGTEAIYPKDLAFFKEIATYWIREYKIDGWRLDRADQVPLDAWRTIKAAVEQAAAETTYKNHQNQIVHPLGYMVAEIWRNNKAIISNGYGSNEKPALESTFDFPLHYALMQSFAIEESGVGNKPATNLNSGYSLLFSYPTHALPNLMLGSHDLVRFGDLLERGGLASPESAEYWLRHKAAFAFMAAYSGPITIYYGDEIGQEVAGFAEKINPCSGELNNCDDHIARTAGMVDGIASEVGAPVTNLNAQQRDLKQYFATLMRLRDSQPALYRGARLHVYSDSNIYIDRKDADGGSLLYVANIKATPAVINIDAKAIGSRGDLRNLLNAKTIHLNNNQYVLQLEPFEAAFLKIAQPTYPVIIHRSLTGKGALADCARPIIPGPGPLKKSIYIRGDYAGGKNFIALPSARRFRYTGDNIYQIVVDEKQKNTAYGFKFATPDWSTEFAVVGAGQITIGAEQTMVAAKGSGSQSSIIIPDVGKYLFSFELNEQHTGGKLMVSLCR